MKCEDCKQAEGDVEVQMFGRTRLVCGNCKRKAYVVYPTTEEARPEEVKATPEEAVVRAAELIAALET